jgi:hypothetical protein
MGQKQDSVKRRTEPKKIALDVSTPKVIETPELADIEPRFAKYISISKDYSMIEEFTCPVEGCNYKTDQGPGSLRMHMVIAADPNMKGRYCPRHQAFVNANPDDMTLDGVRYLAKFPSNLHLDTSLKHIKE